MQVKTDNVEQIEIIYEPSEKKIKLEDGNTSEYKDDMDLDLQIISQRDLKNLESKYLALTKVNELLYKSNSELQKVNKRQEEEIRNLTNQLLGVKDFGKRRKKNRT